MDRRIFGEYIALMDPRWRAAIDATLGALDARPLAAFCPDLQALHRRERKAELWVATDAGLAVIVLQVGGELPLAISDWTAWPDVIEPEVHVEVLGVTGDPHVTLRFAVQHPRLSAESVVSRTGLGGFATAVMHIKAGHHYEAPTDST